MYSIRAKQDTVLKASTKQAKALSAEEKISFLKGREIPVSSYQWVDGHLRIRASNKIWFAWYDYVEILLNGKAIAAIPSCNLRVPYLSQLDNEENPSGSCNVTSVAMCMAYYGQPLSVDGEQLEDRLYRTCDAKRLDRHNPHHLAKLARLYGFADNFQENAKWDDVKAHLTAGNPCIVHGWFTASGHIIVIRGYNQKGWIVNDPYGEWYDRGYDTSRSGANLVYSYDAMDRLCVESDRSLWIHYFSRQ